jgi:DNA-binding response OmpR family regulator
LETILVLEDEPLAMRMICATLRRKNYEVIEAATPTVAARARWERAGLDLLIADVSLPEKSGVRAAVELFQTFPSLAVLFVSGTPLEGWKSNDLLALQLLPRTVWEFLRKPFRAATLEDEVRHLLDRSAAHPLPAVATADGSVIEPTMGGLMQFASTGNDVMTVANPLDGASAQVNRTSRKIPDVMFCPEKVRLTEEFLSAIQELNELQAQQTHAVIHDDPDFSRFDTLIHLAIEKKEHAKYELIRHMEAHHCEEGWNRWQ